MKSIAILVVALMLCPAFAFAAKQQEPVATEETAVVALDSETGDVVGEAVETDELYAPTTKDIKAEAKEEIKEVKGEAKEEVEDIKADEKEALKEAKM